MKRLLLGLAVLLVAGTASAQSPSATPSRTPTATGTETPTATETATATNTATPTSNRQGVLAQQVTCASTPCLLPPVKAGGGQKTIAVNTSAGTATVLVYCRVAPGWAHADFVLGELTGATCATPSPTNNKCFVTTAAYCDEIYLDITACSGCSVNGWLRRDPGP